MNKIKKRFALIFGGTWKEGEWEYWHPGWFANTFIWWIWRDRFLLLWYKMRILLLKSKIKLRNL
jgi:hypothetical protein